MNTPETYPICHRICPGCSIGELLARTTDRTNANRRNLLAGLKANIAVEEAMLNATSELLATGQSPEAQRAIRDMRQQAGGLINESVDRFVNGHPEERVVCDQDGPTRFLGRCGAKIVPVQ